MEERVENEFRESIVQLAALWREKEREHRAEWVRVKESSGGSTYGQSVFQRYVDYGRRAEELEVRLRVFSVAE